jgi:hypothetical protein
LKILYLSLVKENLPIYSIPKTKQLADFCTSQKDVSRGISRIPMEMARQYDEDTQFNKTPNFRMSPSNKSLANLAE